MVSRDFVFLTDRTPRSATHRVTSVSVDVLSFLRNDAVDASPVSITAFLKHVLVGQNCISSSWTLDPEQQQQQQNVARRRSIDAYLGPAAGRSDTQSLTTSPVMAYPSRVESSL